jgi:hypothetical protein
VQKEGRKPRRVSNKYLLRRFRLRNGNMDMEASTTGFEAEERCRKGHTSVLVSFLVGFVEYYTCGREKRVAKSPYL